MIISAAVPFYAALSEARLTKTGLISYKGGTGESPGRPQAYAMVKSLLVEPRFSAFMHAIRWQRGPLLNSMLLLENCRGSYGITITSISGAAIA